MTTDTEQKGQTAVVDAVAKPAAPATGDRRGRPGDRGGFRGRGGRRDGGQRDRTPRSEFANKIIQIRRVARVVSGGRRFSFSVAIVIGDKMGRVGVGLGKAADTAAAIDKATRAAKKSMISLNLTDTKSIPHEVKAKYCASTIEVRPAKGRGLVAGSSVRTILAFAGITDVTAKVLSRSHNQLNNARATMEALKAFAKHN